MQSIPAAAPNFARAINVKEGVPQGCTQQCPKWEHKVKITRLRADTPDTYFAAVHRMTGTVNSAPCWFFRRGELLFTGIDWSTRDVRNELGNMERKIDFTFNFSGEPNVTLDYGALGTLEKEGFQYVWPYFEPKKDNAAKVIIPVPTAVYCEQIYAYSDFSFFGFSGP